MCTLDLDLPFGGLLLLLVSRSLHIERTSSVLIQAYEGSTISSSHCWQIDKIYRDGVDLVPTALRSELRATRTKSRRLS